MKTLIESSIEIKGIGKQNPLTIFNIEFENQKLSNQYLPLTKVSGRKLGVFFKYDEDGDVKFDKILLSIIESQDEMEIKNFIVAEINSYLA